MRCLLTSRKSEMINVKPLHSSWEKKKRLRAEEDSIKAFERGMKEAAKKERDEKRKRIEERKKRKEENQKKSEIVQEVSTKLNYRSKLLINDKSIQCFFQAVSNWVVF